jgi:parallel beta-helix repeat protein
MHPGPCSIATLLLLLLPAVSAASVSYQRDANLIVVDGSTVTPSTLKAALPSAPLELVDPRRRVWLLSASVLLTNGAQLRVHGQSVGGDADELRLRSDNVSGGRVVSVTADHGSIDIRATRVVSWDSAAGHPDVDWESYGRAFIRARSRLRAMVLTRLESRMDVVDSEVAWLGSDASESYGLVWKVVAPDAYVLDHVRVHGSVLRSHIHHNYFGLYAAGARGNQWIGNRVHHNIQYGMAPHLRSDDLRIENNDVHDNGHHGITVRQHCSRVVIRDNRVWANRVDGITLHGNSNNSVVAGNQVTGNGESGITLYDSAGIAVRGNTVRDNGQSGIQVAMGSRRNRIEDNDVRSNGFYGVFVGKGRGRPAAGRDPLPRQNQVAGNRVFGSGIANMRTGDPGLNTWANNVEAQHPGPVAVKEVLVLPRPPLPQPP